MDVLKRLLTFLIITVISMAFCTIFLIIYSNNKDSKFIDNFVYHKIRYYENEKINDLVNEIVENKELISNRVIDHKYVNIVAKENNNYSSYVINYYSGNDVKLEELFINNGLELFENKIEENLYLKYPKFIVEKLLTSSKAYDVLENKIIVYFNKPEELSSLDEDYFVEINYVELIIDNVNVLNYTFTLDANYENPNIFKLDSNKKTIAFSFDDGPSGSKTEKIINALKDNKANATFFLVGNKVNNYHDTVKKLADSGCEIGNHSFDHSNLTKLKTKLADNVSRTDEQIKKIIGYTPSIMRPPYGSINDYVKESINKTFFLWSVDTNDWYYRDTAHAVNHIIDNVADGDIVLMHDSYDSTVAAVEEVLPQLYLMGYQVTSISELAKLKGHDLEKNHIYRSFK